MAFNPISGCLASVTIGGNSMSFDEWKFSPKNNLSKVTNFNSSCFGVYIPGITEGEITLSGPYDESHMGFTAGNSGSITLAVGAFSVVVGVLVKSIDLDVKVDDAARLSVSFQTSGTFNAFVL